MSPRKYRLVSNSELSLQPRARLTHAQNQKKNSTSVDDKHDSRRLPRLQLPALSKFESSGKRRFNDSLPSIYPSTTTGFQSSTWKDRTFNLRHTILSTPMEDDHPQLIQTPADIVLPNMFFSTQIDTPLEASLSSSRRLPYPQRVLEEEGLKSYRNDVAQKQQFFKVFKNMEDLIQKNILAESPANAFLKQCHSMSLLPYSLKLHRESGSLKDLKIG